MSDLVPSHFLASTLLNLLLLLTMIQSTFGGLLDVAGMFPSHYQELLFHAVDDLS